MIDKKVIVVATGGTIAMKYDEASQGLVPACTGEDLAAADLPKHRQPDLRPEQQRHRRAFQFKRHRPDPEHGPPRA